ncbi:MAG: rRNA maturation RNase YbeY [Magnetococcales bacterium]|nr:rRNA maturation RNase YbeY [Magnetococcales bacterium]
MKKAVKAVFKVLPKKTGKGAKGEISVRLGTAEEIRACNRTYRGRDEVTNVLSFEQTEPPGPGQPRLLGDILLCHERLVAEAAEQHKTFEAHLTHLVIHGTLHLLGFDHERSGEEARRQEAWERRILERMGYGDPYV